MICECQNDALKLEIIKLKKIKVNTRDAEVQTSDSIILELLSAKKDVELLNN